MKIRDHLLTARELAAYLSISLIQVYRLSAAKKIPVRRIGGALRFDQTEIDEWSRIKGSPASRRVGRVEGGRRATA